MALSSTHPQFAALRDVWQLLRDSYEGERRVKERGAAYLPATSGMRQDGFGSASVKSKGWQDYNAYLQRAVYHNFVEGAVRQGLGKLHSQPSTIELPAALEPLRERATVNGDPLDVLHMKINLEQLITGRLGLLLDLPITPGVTDIPYIATYVAERIINWDDGANTDPVLQTLNLVVLDEKQYIRKGSGQTDFEWELTDQWRVLVLGSMSENEGEGQGTYKAGVFTGTSAVFNEAALIEPSLRGVTLDKIPFVFINAMDTLSTPDKPPLETLADLGMTIYRGEADYRQSLFMQGQDTLVTLGLADDDETLRTGAGAHISIPSTEGDAKYIGVESAGLEEQRTSVENDIRRAEAQSGQFVDEKRQVESGDAIRRRMMAQSVTLTDIAIAGAAGLENILRIAAEWVGANPDEVSVEPNLDFTQDILGGKEVNDWMLAKTAGAPIALQTVWTNLKKSGQTEFETFDDEVAAIEKENETLLLALGPAGTGEPDDVDDDVVDDDNPGDDE